jgi:carbon storage regulator
MTGAFFLEFFSRENFHKIASAAGGRKFFPFGGQRLAIGGARPERNCVENEVSCAAASQRSSWRLAVRPRGTFAVRQQGGKSMLVLTRRVGEVVVIDNEIRITIAAVRGERVRLGITAPKCMHVDRLEVHERRAGKKTSAHGLEAVSANPS